MGGLGLLASDLNEHFQPLAVLGAIRKACISGRWEQPPQGERERERERKREREREIFLITQSP